MEAREAGRADQAIGPGHQDAHGEVVVFKKLLPARTAVAISMREANVTVNLRNDDYGAPYRRRAWSM